MSSVYDNWERLVGATLKREQLRQIALCPSFSSSISSDFDFDSSSEDVSGSIDYAAPSSLTNPSYRGVRSMAFKELKKATRNFRLDLRLAEGSDGIVYKGWIREGTPTAAKGLMSTLERSGTAVAIKKWKPDGMLGSETWLTELNYLSQLDHPNVVKFIGYCSEGDNLALVYELMRKGNLRNHLITKGHLALSWNTRIKVAIGAARGLSFLHDREIPVIHRDFHTDHILLDVDFNAKLSGFGLAKDGPVGDASHISTRVMGTYGFVAPEYVAAGHLTTKNDVFAFGTVLLQILSGLHYFDLKAKLAKNGKIKLSQNGKIKLSRIIDTKLNGQYPRNGALAVLKLAFQCQNPDPELRPRMQEVFVALQQLQDPKYYN